MQHGALGFQSSSGRDVLTHLGNRRGQVILHTLFLMESRQAREERRFPRYAFSCKVLIHELSPSGLSSEHTRAVHGEMRNISQGGSCFHLDQECAVSSLLRCEVFLPGVPAAVPTLVRLQWIHESADGGHLAGVQFLLE